MEYRAGLPAIFLFFRNPKVTVGVYSVRAPAKNRVAEAVGPGGNPNEYGPDLYTECTGGAA